MHFSSNGLKKPLWCLDPLQVRSGRVGSVQYSTVEYSTVTLSRTQLTRKTHTVEEEGNRTERMKRERAQKKTNTVINTNISVISNITHI